MRHNQFSYVDSRQYWYPGDIAVREYIFSDRTAVTITYKTYKILK